MLRRNLLAPFDTRLEIEEIDDPVIEAAAYARFREIEGRLQLIRNLKVRPNFGNALLYGQDETKTDIRERGVGE